MKSWWYVPFTFKGKSHFRRKVIAHSAQDLPCPSNTHWSDVMKTWANFSGKTVYILSLVPPILPQREEKKKTKPEFLAQAQFKIRLRQFTYEFLICIERNTSISNWKHVFFERKFCDVFIHLWCDFFFLSSGLDFSLVIQFGKVTERTSTV